MSTDSRKNLDPISLLLNPASDLFYNRFRVRGIKRDLLKNLFNFVVFRQNAMVEYEYLFFNYFIIQQIKGCPSFRSTLFALTGRERERFVECLRPRRGSF